RRLLHLGVRLLRPPGADARGRGPVASPAQPPRDRAGDHGALRRAGVVPRAARELVRRARLPLVAHDHRRARLLRRGPGRRRRGEAERVMPANTLALYGLEGTEGYDFPLSRRWSDFQTLALGYRGLRPERRFAVGPPRGPELTALRMMNTRFYLAAPGTRAPAPGFRAVYRAL